MKIKRSAYAQGYGVTGEWTSESSMLLRRVYGGTRRTGMKK
jgi:hypothetical protein